MEEEKDREKEPEKVGNSPTKLNEEKSERELEREIKKQRRHFLLEEQTENFVAAVKKMRNDSGHRGGNERQRKK